MTVKHFCFVEIMLGNKKFRNYSQNSILYMIIAQVMQIILFKCVCFYFMCGCLVACLSVHHV